MDNQAGDSNEIHRRDTRSTDFRIPISIGGNECFGNIRLLGISQCPRRFAADLEERIADGSLAESLDVLAPTWIAQIPTDPFDGRPLRYQRSSSGYVVYSVGPDQQDYGGQKKEDARKTQNEEKQAYDITFTVDR